MLVLKSMRFVIPLALALVAFQAGSLLDDLPAKYRGQAPAPSTVVARVNGVDITAKDVEPLLWEWRGADAIQDLVTYQMIKGEADKARVSVSDADVDQEVDVLLGQIGKGQTPETVKAALTAQGLTRSRLFLRTKTKLLLDKIVERSFKPNDMVNVSTIVFKPASAKAEDVDAAIKMADSAYKELKGGASWDKVFTEYNAESRAAQAKGLVGWRLISAFPQSIADELKTLKPGQVTQPAQTDNGIQIFLLNIAGKDATGPQLDQMKQMYLANGEGQLGHKFHDEAKIERFWPPAGS
ncbi:MAG TPA: peptidylprolyl isomerase [Fimbriimonadaceae bacterium]|nr:peptidylprolyl isomerase [Fimbriimonadaceae bacterium]